MKTLLRFLLLVAFGFLIGCAHDNVRVDPVSISGIGNQVGKAKAKAQDISKTGSAPNDPKVGALIADLEAAEAEIAKVQKKLDDQAHEYEKIINRLNYLEPKYSEAVGLLWKWRMIAIALGTIIVVYVGVKIGKAFFFIVFLSLCLPQGNAKNCPPRFDSSKIQSSYLTHDRGGLQLKAIPQNGNSRNGNLASIALNNCPGTTGKCLRAVRITVQKSKGLPLQGTVLSAKALSNKDNL